MRTLHSLTKRFAVLRQATVSAALASLATVAALPAAAQAAPIPAGAKYSCSFENGYCDFYEQSKIGGVSPTGTGTRRSSLVTTSRVGGYGVRLHTEPGDSQVNGSGEWERNDLQKPADSSYCNEGRKSGGRCR